MLRADPEVHQICEKGGREALQEFMEKRCGPFDPNFGPDYTPQDFSKPMPESWKWDVMVILPVKDRYRFMKAMYPHFGITKQQLAETRAMIERLSPARARSDAARDIKRNQIKIYWAGGIASNPILPDRYWPLVENLPHGEAGVGCTTSVPVETILYGQEYNRVILKYLLAQRNLNAVPKSQVWKVLSAP
jgi:hypothetical protein